MNGVLILEKPGNLTSMECVERISSRFNVKAGHSGTLDPKATGLLLIALGEARKAMPVFSGLDKEYAGTMRMHGSFDPGKLRKAMESFTGEIEQTPPRKSAVARRPRKRIVYSLEITGISGREIQFTVKCQAGTYVRKLCSDIGAALGTGANMASLRRTGIGPFTGNDSSTLEDPEILGLEEALDRAGLRRVQVREGSVQKVRDGSPIRPGDMESPGIPKGAYVGIYHGNKVLALGAPREGYIKVERVFNIR